MKHIYHINEENKWKNIIAGSAIFLASCSNVEVIDFNGNKLPNDYYKNKTIYVTVDTETVHDDEYTSYNATNNNIEITDQGEFTHHVTTTDQNNNKITFRYQKYLGRHKDFKKGNVIKLSFDKHGYASVVK